MFPSKSLLAFVALSLSLSVPVLASPVDTRGVAGAGLRFTTRFNATSPAELVAKDRARAKALAAHGAAVASGTAKRSSGTSVGVTNSGVTYIASVGIGSPATSYDLLIDTGSSNTWVGAGKKYVKTSTSESTGHSVSVSYGSGSFKGTEYTDTLTLASGLKVTKQSIGVASETQDMEGIDGILGIGPVALTEDTVSGVSEVPTVPDNLYSQGVIKTEVIGISYAPATSESDANGVLTFGGVDSSKYTGTLSYVDLTTTSPSSLYWGIDESITYDGTTILESTAGIVDTGTTLVMLESSAFDKYIKAVGGDYDASSGVATISSANYKKLKDLDFVIGGKTYSLTANAQIFPRALNNELFKDASDTIYLIVSDLGDIGTSGLDFINGYAFLERFYSVFDTTNKRVGFATTKYTDATTN